MLLLLELEIVYAVFREDMMLPLRLQVILMGRSPWVTVQAACTYSPRWDGSSPNVNCTIFGGTVEHESVELIKMNTD